MQEAATMKTILQAFCDSSGQTPNFQKSYILFSRNVDNNTKIAIKNIFPIPDLQPHTKHLEHPIIFSHNDRNRAYNFIYGKFKGKLTTARANKLNHAGRLTYIQSVLSSIPIYYMSMVLFSKSFLQKSQLLLGIFGGLVSKKTTRPIQSPSDLGMISAKVRTMVDWELEILK